ncbi:MAG: M20/M25/M40 family metallo-hydrolase [Firmicutes bacterium]|nr:M20/M25/M40 family metallo-hydrolase [Bacillota bacterium]
MDKQQIIRIAEAGAAACWQHQLQVLKEFCAIDCGSKDVEGNKKVVDIVCRELAQIENITIERRFFPGFGENIVARLTPPAPDGILLISAHTDTVFQRGDTAAHPYREEGDTAWGLGICDCKAGILVSIEAVKIMQKAGLLPNKEILFIFNCDEEIGSPTGRQVFDQELDGKKVDAAFVFESAREGNGILNQRKGSCAIEIECFGQSAHTGISYESGRSAVLELCHKIIRLYEHNDNERGLQFNTGKLFGSEYGNNVVPDHARATSSVRVSNQADVQRVYEICKELEKEDPYIEGTRSTVRVTKVGTPMERTPQNHQLYLQMAAIGRDYGMEMPEQSTGGSGDAAVFSAKGIPTADALGGYLNSGIHSFDENLKISSLAQRTGYFACVLAMLFAE